MTAMIQSVIKAIELLELFSIQRPRMSLGELATVSGYPKTTIYTILKTLEARGYVERVGEDYALGSAVVSLSQASNVNVEIRDRAAPLLREMADTLGESVYLTVPNGLHILYIYAIESSQRLEARSAIGDNAYYHSTSVGKAVLAYLPAERLEQIIQEVGLPRRTVNTITTRDRLDNELAEIRSRGYSTDNSENEACTYCLGAPIFNSSPQVVASCSVSGNSPAIIGDDLNRHVEVILRAADAVSKRLGYVPNRSRIATSRV